MSDTTITQEKREMWVSIATARINAVTPERQCEITAQERLVKALKTLEQAEARAEKAEKELAGADAEISELRDELEDSRGTEKDAPNILCAIARLVGVFEHCQELGDDMGTMSLDAVQDLLAEKQKAEAENTRLTKMVDWLAELVFDRPCAYACCPFDKHRPTGPDDDDCDKTHIQCWAEAASRAVADSEVKA